MTEAEAADAVSSLLALEQQLHLTEGAKAWLVDAAAFQQRLQNAVAPVAAQQQRVLSQRGTDDGDAASSLLGRAVAEALPSLVAPHDVPVLEHLTAITAEYERLDSSGPVTGLRVELEFRENPYLRTLRVGRTFAVVLNPVTLAYDVTGASEATPLAWHPGKNVTVQLVKKAPKRSGVQRHRPVHSFFRLFVQGGVEAVGEDDATFHELLCAAAPHIAALPMQAAASSDRGSGM